MITVIGVRFKRTGKVYYFDPDGHEYREGDGVIVETARGLEFGEVTAPPHEVPEEQVVEPLKKVLRAATEQDLSNVAKNREKEKEAAAVAADRIGRLGLEMKLVGVEYTFDASKIIFYFTADGRVDFRELIKELAQHFHTRIELRQIGVRDETKMMGGVGPCGREICCAGFMDNFHPVSIRMAKEQNISLNPTKISGLCGRLMCCLEFEYQHYHNMRGKLPPKGADVLTPNGPGVVVENNVLEGKSRVRVTLPDKTLDLVTCPLEELRVISAEEREDALRNPGRFRMADEDEPQEEAEMGFADDSVGGDQSGAPSGNGTLPGRPEEKKRTGRNRRLRRSGGAPRDGQDGGKPPGDAGAPQARGDSQGKSGSGNRKKRRRRPKGGGGQNRSGGKPENG